MRTVIAHYHTFKNSGTSFDDLLKATFGEQHVGFDGPFPFTLFNQDELLKVIQRHAGALAFSSHQIRLPVPTSLWINVLSAVFVRHPLLRARSVYGFSRKTAEELGEDAVSEVERWALEHPFNDWIGQLRANKHLHLISNSQTQIYSGVYGSSGMGKVAEPGTAGAYRISDLEQAKRNLRCVPLLARTEYYEEDVARFPGILARHGIDCEFSSSGPANVTNPHAGESVSRRLELLSEELSEETLGWLTKANSQDLALFEFASGLIEGRAVA